MALGTYDASEVAIVVAGIPVTGFADGSFVTIERNEDSFALVVGTDGEACRSKSNNKSGRVTFTTGQWSSSNALLSALVALDENTPNGDGIGPLIVKDNSGTTLCTAEKAWLTKPAAVEFDREPTSREWVAETNNLVVLVGSN